MPAKTSNIDYHHSSEPTIAVLDDLSGEVTRCWESLGIQLGVKETTIDNISGNNIQHTSPKQKAFQMLKAWRDMGSATYGELGKALKHVDMVLLANKYCAADKSK